MTRILDTPVVGRYALGAAVLGAIALWPGSAQPPVVNVAISVQCAPGACELAESLAIDVWSETRGPQLPLDVVVPSDRLAALDAAGVQYEIVVPDIDAAAAVEHARLHDPVAMRPGKDFFADYKDFEAIGNRLHELAQLSPERVSVSSIGGSVEGRPLWAIQIGHGPTPILVNGTLHAREWISAMVTTCIADRLVRNYTTDAKVRAFVDSTTLWVVPVANPDGYEYSWGSKRYWRKNRRDSWGVDLNRNFSVAFGGAGASKNKSAENYHGPYAFSEPESIALRDFAKSHRAKLHIDFHSYSRLVLYPWGYTGTRTPDHARYAAVGDRMASAIFAEHEKRYALMPAVELYPASGVMIDWTYAETGALAYTIELRPKGPGGRGGFVLPPEQIAPTCDEGMAALMALRSAEP